MSERQRMDESESDWRVSWEANEAAQLETWLSATPAERLAWLEEAIWLAHESARERR